MTCIFAVMSSQAIAGGIEQARPQEVPFHKVDLDRNCNIDRSEFNSVFRTPGDAFARMDFDRDGRISKEEARTSYSDYREQNGMNTPDRSLMQVEIPKAEKRSFWASIKQNVVQSFERRCTDWEEFQERREKREQEREERRDRRKSRPVEPAPQPQPEPPQPDPDPQPEQPDPDPTPEGPGPEGDPGSPPPDGEYEIPM